MTQWISHKISDLGRIVTGKTPPSAHPEFFRGLIPFITPSDMTNDCRFIVTERKLSNDWDKHRRNMLPSHAICVVCIGATIGKVCMTSQPSHTNQQINSVIVDDENFDPFFVYYVLRTKSDELKARAAGAATPIINKTAFSELTLKAPNLQVQHRIGAILGAYDDLIEVNRRRVAVLEEIARGLFEELVILKVGMLPPAGGRYEGSTLPDNWQIVSLADISEIMMGQSPPACDLNKDGAGIAFHQGVTEFGPLYPSDRIFCHNANPKKVARAGDILFSVRAPVGRINIATNQVLLGRGIASIRGKNCPQAFLIAHLRATFHRTDLIGNGAIYKAVGRADIERVQVVLPPEEVLKTVTENMQPIYSLLWNIEQTNRHLAASRDLLLPRLISGELSVASAERQLEEVA
jgi:type I restriction enzyme S subunit